MAVTDTGEDIARARLDRDGRLLSADRRLLDLNAQAGGAIGAPLALPAIAILGRLAARLAVPVSRPAVAADGERDLDLWVDARPDQDAVALEVSGWQARPPAQPRFGDAVADPAALAADGDWRWEADAELRLIALSLDTQLPNRFDASALIGQPLTRLFALEEDEAGGLAILAAAAAVAPFEGQRAIVRDTGQAVVLAARPYSRDAHFLGWRGTATRVERAAPETPRILDAAFADQLGKALRRPLARIVANADTISARSEGPLRSEYVDYAADIGAAGRHLIALLDDLADLEAVERPDFRVAVDELDLADVARRAAGLLAVRAADRGVRIDRPDSGEAMAASGDFRRVLQILVNLIGNAVRYTPQGGQVWLRTESEGDLATVIVADQGKGIAAADQARIFEKFERIDASEPGGSGLGLYIARRLARAMGGDITVDSAPGQGARFALTLPTVRQA